MAPICRARPLWDATAQTACDKEATSMDGRLCAFHSYQCLGLYRGYKRRNADLEKLTEVPPRYLVGKISTASRDFVDIKDKATIREVYEYLFQKLQLLGRVIQARNLHHSHFFAIDNDYGHQKYLDHLQDERHVTVRALGRLGKRSSAVMFEQTQWFDWVKQCQDEEDKHFENENRKVKLEALLFQRHQKEIDRHQREVRAKEDRKRAERFLEETYHQRLSEMSEEEQDGWDPIQDVYGYERDNYVDLIKFFLMLEDHQIEEAMDEADDAQPEAAEPVNGEQPKKVLSKSAKKRANKTKATLKKLADTPLQTEEGRGASVIEMETKEQMRERLRKPVKFERPMGLYVGGTRPIRVDASTPTLPDDEIEVVLDEVAEIKNYLFCRLLLTQTTLLPIAVQAQSIDGFLANENVTRENLRDLCLKLERPGLQDVRDACADFIRERDGVEDLDETEVTVVEEDDFDDPNKRPFLDGMGPKVSRVPERYVTKREKAAKKKQSSQIMIAAKALLDDTKADVLDFGNVTDETHYTRKRTNIKVCGRYMYNYPSEKALNRGGWFHFSVIAKDSDLYDAVELCRNWNEFFELNILCLYHYFPAPKWTRFVGDLRRQQLLQLGFIPYFVGSHAESVTRYLQTGSRGQERRQHNFSEMRSIICGHIKRDDPASRRLIQYLTMETWELRVLVRDRKTGRIVVQPPDHELWILRQKSGIGRASRKEFTVVTEIGEKFFEQMDKSRKWHFGFSEVYDIYVWDSHPGRSDLVLQRKLEEVLTRSQRVQTLKDMFNVTGHLLRTLTRDPITKRVRTIKPDEEVENMWDALDNTARACTFCPKTGEILEGVHDSYKYTEADEVEDAILFPGEATGEMTNNLFRRDPSAMEQYEKGGFDIMKFTYDPDTDNEDNDDSDHLNDEVMYDDGDSDWNSSEDDNEYVLDGEKQALTALTDQFKSWTIGKHCDYFLPILRDPSKSDIIPDTIKPYPPLIMQNLRKALRSQKRWDQGKDGERVEVDFFRFINREKSKAFKKTWHTGDLQPNGIEHYLEMTKMVKAMDQLVMSKIDPGPFELAKYMSMADKMFQERRVVDDAFKAYASIAMFFETDVFLASDRGAPFRDSKLLKQSERALDIPDRRTHKCNKIMPNEFWKEWDTLVQNSNKEPGDTCDDIFPMEWRKAIRAVVIRLFKAGVIFSSYTDFAAGAGTALAEPGRAMDLYIDYRLGIPYREVVGHIQDPNVFDRDYLVTKAHRFKSEYPSARFSVLRLWSAPHFYPLILVHDRREMISFLDDRGRCWQFKFVPKDMPYSEWSMHQHLTMRLDPYKHVFGDSVFVARDLVLVMGKDEAELRRLCEGVTWAVQTDPWRLEVDFWRSFVNVDVDFLEGLDEKWLE